AGVVDVVVTNPNTYTFNDSEAFTYLQAPTVTQISPSQGPTTGGTSVTITGSGFLDGATVTFGGAAATNVVVVSATTITANTRAGSPGVVDVVVTNANTTSFNYSESFTYLQAPT